MDLKVQARLDKELDGKIAMEMAVQDGKHEVEKIDALGKLGPEALIHLSPKEQGEIIASIQRTKAMQGMDAEQILAAAAENSPAVADALKERYRNANAAEVSERERELYQKLTEQKGKETDNIMAIMDKQRADQAAQMDKTIDAIKDIVGKTQQQQQTPAQILMMNPTTGGVVQPQPVNINPGAAAQPEAAEKEKIMMCPGCRAENVLHARFCDNCGNALVDWMGCLHHALPSYPRRRVPRSAECRSLDSRLRGNDGGGCHTRASFRHTRAGGYPEVRSAAPWVPPTRVRDRI